MAVSQGSTILGSDIRSWYTSFNNFINTWRGWGGTNIAALSAGPSNGDQAKASDINTLNNKLTEFKNDTYLKTKSSWWVGASVTQYALIQPVSFATAIGYFASVKCRNTATNVNGCTQTAKSSNGCNETAKSSNGCNQTAKNPNGCNETAKSSNGCNQTAKSSNGCTETAHTATCSPNNAYGACSQSSCGNGCNNTPQSSNGCSSQITHGPQNNKGVCGYTGKNNCSKTSKGNCSSTNMSSNGCGQTMMTNTYTKSGKDNCSSSGKGNCASSGKDNCASSGKGNCASSGKDNCASSACSQGTVIDITCAQTTKSNA